MTAESWNIGKAEAAISMQWHGKHISMEMNKHTAVEELFEMVFFVQSLPRPYSKDHQGVNSQRVRLKDPRAVRQ
jgi:hypothetical protein